jgi:hypothetical protein
MGEEFYSQMQKEINQYEDVKLINNDQNNYAAVAGGPDIFSKDRPLSLL